MAGSEIGIPEPAAEEGPRRDGLQDRHSLPEEEDEDQDDEDDGGEAAARR